MKSALDRLRFARANSFLYSTKQSRDVQSDAPATPESRLLPVFRADVFVMSPLRSRAEFAAVNPARLEKQELREAQGRPMSERGSVIRSWASRLVPTD